MLDCGFLSKEERKKISSIKGFIKNVSEEI